MHVADNNAALGQYILLDWEDGEIMLDGEVHSDTVSARDNIPLDDMPFVWGGLNIYKGTMSLKICMV